jgi:hypothetical protein
LEYLKKFFPKVNFKQMDTYKSPDTGRTIGGPFAVLQMLSDKGYKKVYVVTGADHMEVYKEPLSTSTPIQMTRRVTSSQNTRSSMRVIVILMQRGW